MSDIVEKLYEESQDVTDSLYYQADETIEQLRSELAKAYSIIESQRQRIEALCEGTDGSTPALVQIARLQGEIDMLKKAQQTGEAA